jgi:ADP-ribose pyrophosphatase YjhB (NUDIX family)
MCLIKHPSDDTYLTLKWNKFDWHNFVMGGIEEGEDTETAGRREILEETGFKNLKHLKTLPLVMNSKFYALHKEVNRNIHTTVELYQLENLDQDATKREAHEDFETEWIKYDNLPELKPVAELPYILQWLRDDRVIYTDEGVLINSGMFSGMETSQAREEIVAWLEQRSWTS